MFELPRYFLMNGAGPAEDVGELRKLLAIPSLTHVVLKTHTPEPRPHNATGTDFVVLPDGTSINGKNLGNRGMHAMTATISYMAAIVAHVKKVFVASVYADTPEEFAMMADAAHSAANGARRVGIDVQMLIEFDLGCFNSAARPGELATPPGENPDKVDAILHETYAAAPHVELSLKLPPYTDRQLRKEIASVVLRCPQVRLLSTSNTKRGRLLKPDGTPALGVNNGWGGVGGTALHELALENAADFVQFSEGRYGVVGLGGIRGWSTAEPFFARGCRGVGVATAYYDHKDPAVFEDIDRGIQLLAA